VLDLGFQPRSARPVGFSPDLRNWDTCSSLRDAERCAVAGSNPTGRAKQKPAPHPHISRFRLELRFGDRRWRRLVGDGTRRKGTGRDVGCGNSVVTSSGRPPKAEAPGERAMPLARRLGQPRASSIGAAIAPTAYAHRAPVPRRCDFGVRPSIIPAGLCSPAAVERRQALGCARRAGSVTTAPTSKDRNGLSPRGMAAETRRERGASPDFYSHGASAAAFPR